MSLAYIGRNMSLAYIGRNMSLAYIGRNMSLTYKYVAQMHKYQPRPLRPRRGCGGGGVEKPNLFGRRMLRRGIEDSSWPYCVSCVGCVGCVGSGGGVE
jgi:hypothetical protein